MKRLEHARLVLALVAGPHTVCSLGSYAARNATPEKIREALADLELGGHIHSAEERSRSGQPLTVYRWTDRSGGQAR